MSLWKSFRELSRLKDRMELLELEMKRFRLDADEMYERYRRMSAKIARRADKIEREEPQEEGPGLATNLSGTIQGPGLTPRQKEIQQIVLKRRAGAA